MKKALSFVLAVVMVISLAACSNSASQGSQNATNATNTDNVDNTNNADSGETYTLLLASVTGVATPYYKVQEWFAKEVNSRTDGRVEVQLYPSSQLGNQNAIMEQTMAGSIDICVTLSSIVSSWLPQWGLLDLPYLVKDTDSADALLSGPVGDELLAELETIHLVGFGFAEQGFRQIYNNVRPIEKVDDLKGLKFRAMQTSIAVDTFTSWGTNPNSLPWGECYAALQQGTIDGLDAPLQTLTGNSMQEVTKYATISNHFYTTGTWCMSKASLDKLPQDIQATIMEVGAEAMEKFTQTTRDGDAAALQALKDSGVQISYLSDDEMKKMADLCKPVWEENRSVIGADFYDMAMGELGLS